MPTAANSGRTYAIAIDLSSHGQKLPLVTVPTGVPSASSIATALAGGPLALDLQPDAHRLRAVGGRGLERSRGR